MRWETIVCDALICSLMTALRKRYFHPLLIESFLPSQNLVRAGSSLLDPTNKEHWDQIQRSEGGTAHLLRNFEAYANTLAQNVRKTYLKPFTIVTDNMSEWRCH